MDLAKYLPLYPSPRDSETVIDFETTGLNFEHKDFKVVGVSFANNSWPQGVYFCLKNAGPLKMRALYEAFNCRRLIAHNFLFDGAVLQRMADDLGLPRSWPFIACTKGMASQLENKLCMGAQSSLKTLQISHLGWETKGDVELDEWLVSNGYTTGKAGKSPDKGKMCMAPSTILGKYGGLDSQSTWSLYRLYKRSMKRFPELLMYHSREYRTLGKLCAEQKWGGFNVDHKRLRIYYMELFNKLIDIEGEFRNSEAAPFIDEYNRMEYKEHLANEKYPFKMDGAVSTNWLKWYDKGEEMLLNQNRFKIVGNGSDTGLQWLFFERLFEITEPTEHRDWKGKYKTVDVVDDSGEVITTLRLSKAEKLPFDNEVVPLLGKCGEILARYNELGTEVNQIKNMLDSLVDGWHYPDLKLSGTVSGRCAGGGRPSTYRTFDIPQGHLNFHMYTDLVMTCADLRVLELDPDMFKQYEGAPKAGGKVNIQNQKKTARYMECIRPPKDEAWLQMDVDALEPVVLAELSEDESMMQLYGPGRPPNDVYLFVASKIEQFAAEVGEYYDYMNPTKEGIALAKKHCKKLRGICKELHLSAGYGAGAKKIWMTLVAQGVEITLDEVKAIRTMYWEVFKDVVGYKDGLTAEWKRRGGWFYNGRHRPITVHQHFEKDILNRCIQSTGHDNLLLYLHFLDEIRTERGIPMRPIMVDFHDETVWAVPHEHKAAALKAMEDAWVKTNNDLGGIIPLTGTPEEVKSWASFKCEDWENFSWETT